MLRSHKIRLVPNQAQEVYFAKGCGTARFAWNQAHASQPRPSEGGLWHPLNTVKRELKGRVGLEVRLLVVESIVGERGQMGRSRN